MASYVALLRGVNVGGNNKVPMKALVEMFESLGHEDVATFIQSGNVVFTAGSSSPADIAASLEREISSTFGVKTAVLLRTKPEMRAIAKHNPFMSPSADVSKLQVTFLDLVPDKAVLAKLEPDACAPDEFAVRSREVYSLCPNGFGRSRLVAYLERRLGQRATSRNWNTVNKLLDLMP